MSDVQSIQVTLELLISGEDERSEVIWDRVGWLEDNPDHEAWYYHAPQIVAGEYPLEKLQEGAVRDLAKQMYYKKG
jgi:hypothetical protein